MVRIESVRERRPYGCVCDLQVSTVAELPAKNSSVAGTVILAGSVAYIIQTGDWCTLDDDGKWYSNGEEV